MKSNSYIRYIIGIPLMLLAGCAEPRIAKTNCWSAAATDTTASTKGSSSIAGAGSDVAPCR